jgi:hypothetical protein
MQPTTAVTFPTFESYPSAEDPDIVGETYDDDVEFPADEDAPDVPPSNPTTPIIVTTVIPVVTPTSVPDTSTDANSYPRRHRAPVSYTEPNLRDPIPCQDGTSLDPFLPQLPAYRTSLPYVDPVLTTNNSVAYVAAPIPANILSTVATSTYPDIPEDSIDETSILEWAIDTDNLPTYNPDGEAYLDQRKHLLHATTFIPKSVKHIPRSDNPDGWTTALRAEMASLRQAGTFDDSPVPTDIAPHLLIRSQLVFDIRYNPDGSVRKYKCRLVARGDLQSWDELRSTYAATASSKSINLLIAIAASLDLDLQSIDVNTAFLYSLLEEELYLVRPHGLTDADMPPIVRLRRGIYGLKQAALEWRNNLHSSLTSLGFIANSSDSCIYRKDTPTGYIILATQL